MTTVSLARAGFVDGWVKESCLIIGASLIIALLGNIAFPLPFTPIPFSLRAQVILFLAVCLGGRRAFLATLLFLLEGAMGLPFFAGGKSGLIAFVGPTGGYLIGFLVAAFVTGHVAEKMKKRTACTVFWAMALGNAIILGCGFAHLSLAMGMRSAFVVGVLPFLVGCPLKLMIAAKAFGQLRRPYEGRFF
jgi:biotin transport system substrate-specific component